MAEIVKTYFENTDLNQDFEYTYVHGKGTINIIIAWYDENGVNRTTTDTYRAVDENTAIIFCGGPVSGLQEIVMLYDNSVNITGRRLFELNTATSLTSDYRLALGKAGVPAQNMTISTFTDTISNGLLTYFYNVNNNLSEISNQAAAQTNLGVYSKSVVDTLVGGKVDKNSSLSQLNANSLSLPNYYPTVATDLVTKGYLDNQKPTITNLNTFTGVAHPFLTNRTIHVGTKYDFNPLVATQKQYCLDISFNSSQEYRNHTNQLGLYLGRIPGFRITTTRYFNGFSPDFSNTFEGCIIEVRGVTNPSDPDYGQAADVYCWPGLAGNWRVNIIIFS